MEIAGYWAVSADTDQISDAMFHMISVGGEYHGSVLSPGLYYSIPTNDSFESFLDGVLVIRLRISLN
jgi:hypothetical protein